MKRRVSRFMAASPYPICHGKRLEPEALSVTFRGLDIADLSDLPVRELVELLKSAVDEVPGGADSQGAPYVLRVRRWTMPRVVKRSNSVSLQVDQCMRRLLMFAVSQPVRGARLGGELISRLRPIMDLGLGYLSLGRTTPPGRVDQVRSARLCRRWSESGWGARCSLTSPN